MKSIKRNCITCDARTEGVLESKSFCKRGPDFGFCFDCTESMASLLLAVSFANANWKKS